MNAAEQHSIRLPALGDDERTRGQVISLLDPGSEVSCGQIFMEVETDKVVVEIPSEIDGVIEGYTVAIGDSVCGGDVVGVINKKSSGSISVSADMVIDAGTSPQVVIDRCTINSAGSAPINDVQEKVENAVATTETGAATQTVLFVPAGPAARQLARTMGVRLADVTGTGCKGRITKDDVKRHVRELLRERQDESRVSKIHELPDIAAFGLVERQPLSGIAKATSRNMQKTWSEIPHAWVQEDIDITDLDALRKAVKARSKAEIPLTVTAILCKVVAIALAKFPVFNSAYDKAGESLVIRRYINIGVAIDTARGLVVPGIRDVVSKSAIEIAEELKSISGRAVASKLTAADFQGNGFTISNLGGIGVSGLLPLVNWPEVAILGVSSSREQCRLYDDRTVNRLIMPVTLGFDHRVINGADAARFLSFIKEIIEQPGMLLIGG